MCVIVEKIECTNHFLRSFVIKYVKQEVVMAEIYFKIIYILKLKKVVTNVMKIRNAVVKTVSFCRNNEISWNQDKIAELIKNLQNIPSHVFDKHKDYTSLQYFCTGEQKGGEKNLVPQLQKAGLFLKIKIAMKCIIENVDYYINLLVIPESYNGIISKMIDGKRIHYAKRSSYETRVKASVVQILCKHWVLVSYYR